MKNQHKTHRWINLYPISICASLSDSGEENECCEDAENSFYRPETPKEAGHHKNDLTITVKAGHKRMGEIIRMWESTRYKN